MRALYRRPVIDIKSATAILDVSTNTAAALISDLVSAGVLTEITGSRPVGWMTGRPSPNTRQLLVEEGGFLYDRDALNDELPYWVEVSGRQHLVIP